MDSFAFCSTQFQRSYCDQAFHFCQREKIQFIKNIKLSWCYIKLLSHFTCKYITKQFSNSAHNLHRLGPLISLALYVLVGKSISRLWHLDGTEMDLKVSVNVIFSILIRIFVSSGIAEGKL